MTRHVAVDGLLFDLLMGVMNSMDIWAAAAHDVHRGLAWRDAVTARMISTPTYASYEDMVMEAATTVDLPSTAGAELFGRWAGMQTWPDAPALSRLRIPYAFVTNCSADLARIATRQSGLHPRFTLSAQDAGRFKPDARVYREA